jgi:arylsulfatase A-like enzyme
LDRTLFWRTLEQDAARRGRWKYLRTESDESLFDLSQDPGERADLASYDPDTLAALRAEFRAWNQKMLPRPQ